MKINRTMPKIKTIQRAKQFRAHLPIILLLLAFLAALSGCQEAGPPPEPTAAETIPVVSSPTAEATQEPPTPTIQPTSTPEPSPTFDITSVEDWGAGRLLFTLEERSFGDKNYWGVFQLDLETEALSEISPAGSQLLDISPDHKRILVSRESELSLIDLETGSTRILVDGYFHLSPSGAKWDPATNSIYYLAENGAGIQLLRINPDSGEQGQIAVESAVSILDVFENVIILGKGSCNPFGECTIGEVQWIDVQGTEITTVEPGDAILLPCQRGDAFVYSAKTEQSALSLHIRSHDPAPEVVFWALNTEYADCAWSPDGSRLAVIVIDRFWYSGSILEYYFQVLFPASNQIQDLSYLNAPLDNVAWSPDGAYTVFTGTAIDEDIYQVEINLMELNSMRVARYGHLSQLQSENYLTIPQVFWAP